jgi:hypothetical protein
MTKSSKQQQPSSPPYVPVTAEEKEEAFRLAAELFREVKKDLEQDPPEEAP